MGIKSSIIRRRKLAQGFSPLEGILVFFGSQDFRRKVRSGAVRSSVSLPALSQGRLFRFVNARFARCLQPACGGDAERSFLLVALGREVLDPNWYAARHRLAGHNAALRHFLTIGLTQRLAPAEAYADAKGEHLSDWGAEFLSRLGLPIGLRPAEPEAESAAGVVGPVAPTRADLMIRNSEGKRLAVAATCFSDTDRVPDVDPDWADRADFYLFTDRPITVVAPWKLVTANYHTTDPHRRALFYKTHLPALLGVYDWGLWISSGTNARRDPMSLVEALIEEGAEFGVPARMVTRGLVEEAVACLEGRLERAEVLRDHLAAAAEHPAFHASEVLETRFVLMKTGSRAVRRLCGAWWRYVANGASCDQLSLPLALADVPDLDWRKLSPQCTDALPP